MSTGKPIYFSNLNLLHGLMHLRHTVHQLLEKRFSYHGKMIKVSIKLMQKLLIYSNSRKLSSNKQQWHAL